jgi:hypothetical protein
MEFKSDKSIYKEKRRMYSTFKSVAEEKHHISKEKQPQQSLFCLEQVSSGVRIAAVSCLQLVY